MLESIYVDNYKCFSNTTVDFQSLNLLLGDNGSGKTALFDVLTIIRSLVVDEAKVAPLLPPSSLTRWQRRTTQTFELKIRGNGGTYRYALDVDHQPSENKRRVRHERLEFDGAPLFDFELGEVQLYRDDASKGPSYPFDWSRSGLATIMPRSDNERLTWFKERVANIHVLHVDPRRIASQSDGEAAVPSDGFSNFVSWYRHHSQERPERQFRLFEDLRDAIEGFETLKVASDGGDTRTMKVSVAHQPDDKESVVLDYTLDELSHGQRALIVLYAILRFIVREDVTLCIDEPENFLALPEIQPWLLELADVCGSESSQAVLISHHPEFLNLLAPEKGILFERPSVGPVRTRALDVESVGNISVSELVARGWHQ